MKSSLAAGVSRSTRIIVDEARTISFMGEECRVYAMLHLVKDIEAVCRNLLLDHLDPGEDSVGKRIELDHLAPTLMGMPVEIAATVAEVKGREVAFDVNVRDSIEPTARGKHVWFVVDVAATAERLKRKAAKVKMGGQ
jgi:fluoroacetyl-CoA thioesterase